MAITLPDTGVNVDQLRDILQSLSEAGHGNLPVHALAEGLTGPVRSADVVPGWNPTVGTVTLLSVDADAAPELLAIAREVDRMFTSKGWLDTGYDPESRLLVMARKAVVKYGA